MHFLLYLLTLINTQQVTTYKVYKPECLNNSINTIILKAWVGTPNRKSWEEHAFTLKIIYHTDYNEISTHIFT